MSIDHPSDNNLEPKPLQMASRLLTWFVTLESGHSPPLMWHTETSVVPEPGRGLQYWLQPWYAPARFGGRRRDGAP